MSNPVLSAWTTIQSPTRPLTSTSSPALRLPSSPTPGHAKYGIASPCKVPATARPPIRDEKPNPASKSTNVATPMNNGPLPGVFDDGFEGGSLRGLLGGLEAGAAADPADTFDMTSLTNPSLRLGGFGRGEGFGESLLFSVIPVRQIQHSIHR